MKELPRGRSWLKCSHKLSQYSPWIYIVDDFNNLLIERLMEFAAMDAHIKDCFESFALERDAPQK